MRNTKFTTYLRVEHNITLKTLSNMTGIPYNTLQKYSQRAIKPSPDKVQILSEALLVKPDEIINVLWR